MSESPISHDISKKSRRQRYLPRSVVGGRSSQLPITASLGHHHLTNGQFDWTTDRPAHPVCASALDVRRPPTEQRWNSAGNNWPISLTDHWLDITSGPAYINWPSSQIAGSPTAKTDHRWLAAAQSICRNMRIQLLGHQFHHNNWKTRWDVSVQCSNCNCKRNWTFI